MSEIRKKERRGKDTRNFMTLFMMHAYTVKTEENNRGYTVLLQTTLPLLTPQTRTTTSSTPS